MSELGGAEMLQVDQPHLQHVLQIVSALEAVVLRSFGPNGGQVLFTKDTGDAIITRSGTRILAALRLKHPLARMLLDCVWKHSRATGDGSKTFILLLASLLRMFRTTLQTTTAWRLAYELLEFATTKLDEVIFLGVLPYGSSVRSVNVHLDVHRLCLKKLLTPFFHTRLSHTHCDMISDLICEFLVRSRVTNDHPSSGLHFVHTNFPALHTVVPGIPVTRSLLIEGQVIHRDFAVHCPQTDKQPVKAVVLTQHVQPTLLGESVVLKVGFEDPAFKKKSVMDFTAWSETSLQLAFASLQSFGVTVLLSAVKQSLAFLALAAQAEMCVVECISEDELSLFAQLSRTTPVVDCRTIEAANVSTLTFCRPLTLGVRRYVHVAFPDSEQDAVASPSSLVICSSGKEQTDQYTSAFQDGIRMLLITYNEGTTLLSDKKTCSLTEEKTEPISSSALDLQQHMLDSCCVVPAGGTFEILLSHALLQHGDRYPVSRPLSDALLSVARHISPQTASHFLPVQTTVLTQCDGLSSKAAMSRSSLESVSCKHMLLQSVLWCAASLLRVDMILYTPVALNTNSQKPADDSWDNTEG